MFLPWESDDGVDGTGKTAPARAELSRARFFTSLIYVQEIATAAGSF